MSKSLTSQIHIKTSQKNKFSWCCFLVIQVGIRPDRRARRMLDISARKWGSGLGQLICKNLEKRHSIFGRTRIDFYWPKPVPGILFLLSTCCLPTPIHIFRMTSSFRKRRTKQRSNGLIPSTTKSVHLTWVTSEEVHVGNIRWWWLWQQLWTRMGPYWLCAACSRHMSMDTTNHPSYI